MTPAARYISSAYNADRRRSPAPIHTPHDIRRSFSNLAAAHFGWSIDDVKMILDHNEGRASGDVTAMNYLYDGTHQKWPIVRSWATWVDEHTVAAIEYDDRLLDLKWLEKMIDQARDLHKYGITP